MLSGIQTPDMGRQQKHNGQQFNTDMYSFILIIQTGGQQIYFMKPSSYSLPTPQYDRILVFVLECSVRGKDSVDQFLSCRVLRGQVSVDLVVSCRVASDLCIPGSGQSWVLLFFRAVSERTACFMDFCRSHVTRWTPTNAPPAAHIQFLRSQLWGFISPLSRSPRSKPSPTKRQVSVEDRKGWGFNENMNK